MLKISGSNGYKRREAMVTHIGKQWLDTSGNCDMKHREIKIRNIGKKSTSLVCIVYDKRQLTPS